MGVPAFFKWLSMKYPSIVQHCVEKHGEIIDDEGRRAAVNTLEPNPNLQEFDNLYLDMNGIIHPCTHPENKAPPKNEAEMFEEIFAYIDRIFAIVRPRRLLYMAIDGVAPRAKMNQQRSRRFRSAQETHLKEATIKRLRAELLAKGANLPPPKDASEHFDSNCITPGTPFMDRLAVALRYYVCQRLSSDQGWKNIQVILSDSNAPGEGEHKIMDFIRRQRASPSHDANTKHCLCGADADLIMLGLATHEPHFSIIREEFKPNQPRPCDLCGQYGHDMEECGGLLSTEDSDKPPSSDVEFIFIHLAILREYLAQDLPIEGLSFEWNLERAIDDWVFMCFFVGNDFLPHLPSLEIREGAIDKLIDFYKLVISDTGGWLTDSGRVNLPRVQLILAQLGRVEDAIFKARRNTELSFRERRRRNHARGSGGGHWSRAHPARGLLSPLPPPSRGVAQRGSNYNSAPHISARQLLDERRDSRRLNVDWVETNLRNLEAAASLKAMLKGKHKSPTNLEEPTLKARRQGAHIRGRLGGCDASVLAKKPTKDNVLVDEDEFADSCDEVKLWEDGWRQRYYQSKFGVTPSDATEFCLKVARQYVRGLCWVLAYYYQGCASWDWYFPYHYAPFASDFTSVESVDASFAGRPTKPFCPLEQLMGVFPAASKAHVPPAWQDLMDDPNSPIIDFYPTDFKVDLNGKRFAWMGVALMPFVDEVRLLRALDSRRHLLTSEEVFRNERRPEMLFCHANHPLGRRVTSLYSEASHEATPADDAATLKIEPKLTAGIAGRIWLDSNGPVLPNRPLKPPQNTHFEVITPDLQKAVSIFFQNPAYPDEFIFPAKLLEAAKPPPAHHLMPSERGRCQGFARGRNSLSSGFRNNHNNRGYNQSAGLEPMHRMIRSALPSWHGNDRGFHQPYPNPYSNRGLGESHFSGAPRYHPRQRFGHSRGYY